jgi:polyisoprenoid-binding protein YceI
MRVSRRWKLLLALSLALLAGCPSPPRAPAPVSAPGVAAVPAPHVGTPFEILPQSSLLTILVYRGGALASAGHNHVIASHDLSGAIFIPSDILHSSFEVHLPVATLTVDEAALRAQQSAADFPPDVSEGAKEGTRHNMLGEALLDAEHNPEIVLRSLQLERADGAAADSGTVRAHIESSVRGQLRTFTAPVRYRRNSDGTLEVSGDFQLRQSELGLTPFSAMLGALQVQDEMRVSFHIVARAAAIKTDPSGTL